MSHRNKPPAPTERLFKAVVESAPAGVVMVDDGGAIVLVNRETERLFGYTRDELIGQSIETLVPQRFRAGHHASRSAFVANTETRAMSARGDLVGVHKNGTEVPIEIGLNPVEAEGRVFVIASVIDIGPRKQAEEELRRSESRYRSLIEGSIQGILIHVDGVVQLANPALARLLGVDLPEDFVGTTVWPFIAPEDRTMVTEYMRGRSDGKPAPSQYDFRAVKHDGTVIWLSCIATTIQWDGHPAILATVIDITKRRQAEEDLRASEELSALRAAVGLALAETDSLAPTLQRCAQALVTHLRAASARIWTLNERKGVLELQASAGLHTQLNGSHEKIPLGQFKIGRIAQNRTPYLTNGVIGDPEVLDQEWARREGMVAFAGHPLMLDGRVVGVMALFARHALSDAVTAALASVADHIALGIGRHRSAEALRTAEERMRFALEAAGVGIWDHDFTTEVIRWSEILEAQYGLQAGTFGGTFEAFVECIHPDDRESMLDTIGKAMKSGADFTFHHRTLWPDGTLRWLTGAGRVHLGEHGKPVRAVGITLDVTERRTLEEQFHQAQKIEAIGRLAGGVAHDFNNLLTAILGYCELALEDVPPGDRHRTDLEEIQKAGMRAAGLTRQLLAFSRKQIIEPTVLDLNVVVVDIRRMLGRLIGEDVQVLLELATEPVAVKADRGQVEQIVMNLAVNARDAMPEGGTLRIATAYVDLDQDYAATHVGVKAGPYAALTVADTGTGMTPQVQARLFEPFFTTKDVGKGTGLGLATVHGIVKQSGGSIGVYSEVGKGTAFHVYFPRVDAAETVVQTEPPVAPRRTHAATVLVVEDAEALRDLARRFLQRQGYTVLVAANADDALRLSDENSTIDVLLTDVVMPGASGPQLAGQLVERHPALRVIHMSGYTEDAIVQHGVLKPGIAFLHKPFTSETLERKIREVLDR